MDFYLIRRCFSFMSVVGLQGNNLHPVTLFPPVAKQQCLNQGAVCKEDPNKSINSSALHAHAKEFYELYFIFFLILNKSNS